MKHLNIIILAVMVSALSARGAEDGKHLFILSGQSNMSYLDPNISFTPKVQAAFGKENVIVVKSAHGGQPISRWYKYHKETKPGGKKSETRGDFYVRLLKKVQLAMQGKTLQTVTFVWMQGESDVVCETVGVYGDCLGGLLGQLKTDLRFDDINFVIGRINDYGTKTAKPAWNIKKEEWEKLRVTQVEFAESYRLGGWVDTDDLNDVKDDRGRTVKNALHNNGEGYRILGQRFAEQAIALIKKKPNKAMDSDRE